MMSTTRQVRCRVTGSSLVEGWAAVSMRSSVLSAAVLRYEDLRPGAMVEGEVGVVGRPHDEFYVCTRLSHICNPLISGQRRHMWGKPDFPRWEKHNVKKYSGRSSINSNKNKGNKRREMKIKQTNENRGLIQISRCRVYYIFS